jgi:FAD binding domain
MTTSVDLPHDLLIRRGDARYEEARTDAIWNARKPDRYPDAILLARTEQDVVAGVRWAKEQGLKISVRSGGHSWVGNGIRDDGLLIDMSRMQDIAVDAAARRVRVHPAMRGPEINRRLAEHGLFFPTGHAPTVGIGGFALGGGYGWNSRSWGPACLSIEAIDVVLATGELVHATDDNHPELLWAARGCGPGFFGVVTRFELAAYPVHQRILRSSYSYPIELRDEVLAWTYDLLPETPAAVEMSVKVGHTPALGIQAASITSTVFCQDATDYNLLEPLEHAPFRKHALRESVNTETTLARLYDIADALTPPGLRWALDGIWCDAPAREILTAAAPLLDNIPDDDSGCSGATTRSATTRAGRHRLRCTCHRMPAGRTRRRTSCMNDGFTKRWPGCSICREGCSSQTTTWPTGPTWGSARKTPPESNGSALSTIPTGCSAATCARRNRRPPWRARCRIRNRRQSCQIRRRPNVPPRSMPRWICTPTSCRMSTGGH